LGRQFREDPGILQGISQPDGERCVAIYTSAEQHEMVLSAVLSVMVPVAVGLVPGCGRRDCALQLALTMRQ
jgi:K(+)-stimulated pyrophosphate-energized sodium pump